jgi:hypothetical protein
MIKNHLRDLLDIKLIIAVVILIAMIVILTMIFREKAKDFKSKYNRKFYIYILSLMFIYAIVSFLGFNKLFITLRNEFVFYQIVSLILGGFHTYFYRWYFNKFGLSTIAYEMLFTLIVVLCSAIPFILIFTALSGINLTYLMCTHFLVFFLPSLVNELFNLVVSIPPKIYLTWKIPENSNLLPVLEDSEMRDIVVVTLLIKKNEDDIEYSSFRAKGPIRMDFGRLFYYAITNYNVRYPSQPVKLSFNDGPCDWVFHLQPKWYESAKYVDARYTLSMNGITENSVIICQRAKEATKILNDDNEKSNEYMYDAQNTK